MNILTKGSGSRFSKVLKYTLPGSPKCHPITRNSSESLENQAKLNDAGREVTGQTEANKDTASDKGTVHRKTCCTQNGT